MAQRRGEGLLHRLFGAIEGAAQPDQPSDDPAVLAAKHRFDRGADFSQVLAEDCMFQSYRGGMSAIGRISMQPSPPPHAVGIFAAQPIASSRFAQSRM